MRILTIRIESLEGGLQRFKAAWDSGEPQGEYLTFPDLETLLKHLTGRRWTAIQTLQQQGPLGLRELARKLERDPKNVHGDVTALIELGLVERSDGKLRVPFDVIHTEFTLARVA